MYQQYREILGLDKAEHPQAQGLSCEEFDAALHDPATVPIDTGDAVLPQLTPVSHYGWLNHDFYRSRFGSDDDPTKIMQFTDYPDIQISAQTTKAIVELGLREGIVAFDIPSNHPDSYERIVRALGSAGVSVHTPELLGTQTYFAGKIELALPNLDHEQHSHGLIETFQSIPPEDMAEKLPMADRFNGVWLHDRLDDAEEVAQMYDFYSAAYEVLNDHPCKQGLDPDEFLVMLKDKSIPKIVFRNDGVAETLYIITNKIDELSWVNYNFYAEHYADEIAENKLLWFPGIATNPEAQLHANSFKIISMLIRLCKLGNYDPTIVFDFCDYNTGKLDKAIEYMIRRTREARLQFKEIANQKYFATRVSSGI